MNTRIQQMKSEMNGSLVKMKNLNEQTSELISIEDLVELGDRALGLKVLVKSSHHCAHGVINYILPDCQRLALEKASNPKNGKIHLGLMIYLFFEIKSITIIGQDIESRKRLVQLNTKENQLVKGMTIKKLASSHLAETDLNDDDDDDDDNSLVEREEFIPSDIPLPEPPPGHKRPACQVIIDKMDEQYEDAIRNIELENTIGLSVRGQNIGRNGTLTWLNISTTDTIYFFDLAVMDVEEVMRGNLGQILSNEAIIKVIHDSRFLEDFLHHCFDLNLINVFDTQAAVIYHQMISSAGSVPSFVSALPNLLEKYLNFNPDQIIWDQNRQEDFEDDDMIWLQRPLSNLLYQEMFQSIAYLTELRKVLLDLILIDFHQVTNIFMSSVRMLSSVAYSTIEPCIVPHEVQKLARRSICNDSDLCGPKFRMVKNTLGIKKRIK